MNISFLRVAALAVGCLLGYVTAAAAETGECSDSQLLSGLDVIDTGKAKAMNVRVATAFSKAASSAENDFVRATSLTVSTSTPVESGASAADYGRLQLLSQSGGIVNILFHKITIQPSDCAGNAVKAQRLKAADRIYRTNPSANDDSYALFLSNGLGIKGIRPDARGGALKVNGVAYLGVGVDGALFSDLKQSTNGSIPGFLAAELRYSVNAVGRAPLNQMFSTIDAPRTVNSLGFNFEATLPGSFYVNLGYAKGLGSYGRQFVKEISTVTLGFRAESKN